MTGRKMTSLEKAHWEATSKGHGDARSSLSLCPLMGNKVQLLPLRYGRVERLDSPTDVPVYQSLKRPVGLRLLRDGYLYVIDESSGYLHEYRIDGGVPVKLLWQGCEVAQDLRQTSTGETALVFPRNSVLYVAYAELQWTAAKCSHVLGSAADRQHFMQRVNLAEADCEHGGVHLRVERQVRAHLAELAEQPAPVCASPDIPEEELQDYSWESDPLYREAHIGELKNALNPYYQHNHLYLVVQDSIGILRDLADEQDSVVTWIEQWRKRTDNDLRYPVASYIDTLIKVGDHAVDGKSRIVEKTTPEQRTRIYEYVDARNDWLRERSHGPVPAVPNAGQPAPLPSERYQASPGTQAARREMERRQTRMVEALGDPLHGELKKDIEALEDRSQGALAGIGLGARGINDLIRIEEMQRYLAKERTHLKRWTERLDAISADRIHLFESGEFHRSAWYFDPEHPDQLRNALAMEFNCTRDMGRTEACMERLGEYFHKNPHFILPVFYGRLNLNFLLNKSGDLIKWLDSFNNFPKALVEARQRVEEIIRITGNHWTLDLEPQAFAAHQAVNASYVPSIALRMEQWLAEMRRLLDTPDLRGHLDTFSRFSNRAHRLGMLVALQVEGATLSIANEADIADFKARLARLNQLLAREDRLIRDRDFAARQARVRTYSTEQRQEFARQKQSLNSELRKARNERSALRHQLEADITPVSSSSAGHIGVKLRLTPDQQRIFDDEVGRFRARMWRGYGTAEHRWTGLKSGMIPLLVAGLMAMNFQDVLEAWRQSSGNRTTADKLVFFGSLMSVAAASLVIGQSVAMTIANEALQATIASTGGKTGRLFQVRIGQLGLGLGSFISALSLFGTGTASWSNWSKWQEAFITGTAGEKSGAFLGLVGDVGTTATTTLQTASAGIELSGFASELLAAPRGRTKYVASQAWATRGARFLHFSARLMPISLAFTALQLGGEALYNYSNLDDQQRWLLACIWGREAQGWDWNVHAQKLAEATLKPSIVDKGIQPVGALNELARNFHIVLPGLTAATSDYDSLQWAVDLHDGSFQRDVTKTMNALTSIVATSPLTLEVHIPPEWQGHQSSLQMRLAVKPAMAHSYLKVDEGHLYYRISLGQDSANRAIRPRLPVPEKLTSRPLSPIIPGVSS